MSTYLLLLPCRPLPPYWKLGTELDPALIPYVADLRTLV